MIQAAHEPNVNLQPYHIFYSLGYGPCNRKRHIKSLYRYSNHTCIHDVLNNGLIEGDKSYLTAYTQLFIILVQIML